MSGILDRVARSKGLFIARSLSDVFAIQLARWLGDERNMGMYLKVARVYAPPVLADAAKRIRAKSHAADFESFYTELTHGRFRGTDIAASLVVLKVAYRELGTVVLEGSRIADVQSLQLATDTQYACRSAAGFAARLAVDQPDATVGIYSHSPPDEREVAWIEAIEETARAAAMPIVRIATTDVLDAVAVPALSEVEHARAVAQAIWPELVALDARPSQCDAATAAALLYCWRLLPQEEMTKGAA